MSPSFDRFREHAIHNELAELKKEAAGLDVSAADASAVGTLQRIRRVAERVSDQLAECDPDLISRSLIKALYNQVHALRDRLREVQGNAANWQQLDEACDSLAHHLYLFPAPIRNDRLVPDFSAALEDYRSAASEAIAIVQDQQRQLEVATEAAIDKASGFADRLSQYDQAFEQQKGRVDKLISDHQQQFSDAQSKRQAEYERKRSEWESQALQAVAAAKEMIQQSSRDASDALSSAQSDWIEAIERQLEETRQAVKGLVSQIETRLEEAKKLVGIIGNVGVTGNYQRIADQQGAAADWFRRGALVFLVAAVFGVVWIVVSLGENGFSWEMAAFRFLSVLTLLLPAAYCARESNRHRETEHRNRRLELELASVAPFLEGLDQGKIDEIRVRLAGSYFGNVDPVETEDVGTIKLLVPVLRDLAKILRP